jgi:hypothetical protein
MKSAVAFDPEFDPPAKGPEKGRLERRLVVAVAIQAGVFGAFILILNASFVNSWNSVPSRPPDEANRVVHPREFSMIVPPGWESKVGVSSPFDSITSTARQLIPDGRHRTEIHLERSGTRKPWGTLDPDLRPVSFQGQPARERSWSYPGGGDVKDPTPRFHYERYFQRNGQWYALEYRVPRAYQSLPPLIQHYFDTFRHESPPESISPDTAFLQDGPGTKDKGQRTKDQ